MKRFSCAKAEIARRDIARECIAPGLDLRDLDNRALAVTRKGRRVLRERFRVEP
jgi:hypothetical protein